MDWWKNKTTSNNVTARGTVKAVQKFSHEEIVPTTQTVNLFATKTHWSK